MDKRTQNFIKVGIMIIFLLALLAVVFTSKVNAQPYYQYSGLGKHVPCPTCGVKKVVTAIKPHGNVNGIPIQTDLLKDKADSLWMYYTNNNTNYNIIYIPEAKPAPFTNEKPTQSIVFLNNGFQLGPWGKILVGVGFEASGVGLILLADKPKTESYWMDESYFVPYQYTNWVNAGDNCKPNEPKPRNDKEDKPVKYLPYPGNNNNSNTNTEVTDIEVINTNTTVVNTTNDIDLNVSVVVNIPAGPRPVTKTGYLPMMRSVPKTRAVERDKAGYYIGAGASFLTGLVFQFVGIKELTIKPANNGTPMLGYTHSF